MLLSYDHFKNKPVNILDLLTQEVSFIFQEVGVHNLKALKMKSAIYHKVNNNDCIEPIFMESFLKCIWEIFDVCLLKFFKGLFYFTF